MSPYGNVNLARQQLKKVAVKHSINYEKRWETTSEKTKLTMKLFDALISFIPDAKPKAQGHPKPLKHSIVKRILVFKP